MNLERRPCDKVHASSPDRLPDRTSTGIFSLERPEGMDIWCILSYQLIHGVPFGFKALFLHPEGLSGTFPSISVYKFAILFEAKFAKRSVASVPPSLSPLSYPWPPNCARIWPHLHKLRLPAWITGQLSIENFQNYWKSNTQFDMTHIVWLQAAE